MTSPPMATVALISAVVRVIGQEESTEDILQPPLCDLRVNEDDFGLQKKPLEHVGGNIR